MLPLGEIATLDYTGWFYLSQRPTDIQQFHLDPNARVEHAGARGLCYRKFFSSLRAKH